MTVRQIFFFFLLTLLVSGIVFADQVQAVKTSDGPYGFCLSQIDANSNVGLDCSEYISQSADLEKYLNFAYSSEIDGEKYLDCLFSEKKNTFDSKKMMDICLNKIVSDNQIKKQLDLFKVSCNTNYNPLEGNLEVGKDFTLEVNCSGVVPATCYKIDTDFNSFDSGFGFESYKITPIITKSDTCLNYAVFRYLKKDYVITPKSTSLFVNIDQPILKTTDGKTLDYSSLIIDEGSAQKEIDLLSYPEKEYYSCLAKYALFSKKTESSVLVLNNGKVDNFQYPDLETACGDKVLYATKVNVAQLLKSKEIVKKNMVYLLQNITNINPNNDLEKLITSLETYYKIYEKNMTITSGSEENGGVVKIILDLDYILESYILKKQQTTDPVLLAKYEDELIGTIEINVYNRLYGKIYREPTIKEFISEVNNVLNTPDYISIKDSVIANYVMAKFESGLDVNEDLEIKATKDYFFIEGVKLSKEFTNLIVGDYNFSIIDGVVLLDYNGIKIYSEYPLSVIRGKDLYVDDINVVMIYPEDITNADIMSHKLYVVKENGHILYNFEKTEQKMLLGFIKITEVVTDVYNAETGLKLRVNRPWWDFLAK